MLTIHSALSFKRRVITQLGLERSVPSLTFCIKFTWQIKAVSITRSIFRKISRDLPHGLDVVTILMSKVCQRMHSPLAILNIRVINPRPVWSGHYLTQERVIRRLRVPQILYTPKINAIPLYKTYETVIVFKSGLLAMFLIDRREIVQYRQHTRTRLTDKYLCLKAAFLNQFDYNDYIHC